MNVTNWFASCRMNKNTFLRSGICLLWCAGLSLGLLAARFYGDALNAYIRLAPGCAVRYSSSLVLSLFPFLISALAVCCFRPACLCLAVYFGACFGFTIVSAASAFGGAGFAVIVLLLFRSLLCAPVLLWFLVAAAEREVSFHTIAGSAVYCLLISSAETMFAAPLLCEIINY